MTTSPVLINWPDKLFSTMT